MGKYNVYDRFDDRPGFGKPDCMNGPWSVNPIEFDVTISSII